MNIVHLAVSVLPVLLFLTALIFLDGYKLVPLRSIFAAVGVGMIAALMALLCHNILLREYEFDARFFSKYIAPVIEEFFKAASVIYLIRSGRVGFVVDAAIFGFAMGAGFSVVENVHYVYFSFQTSLITWIIRGFGTALMHGGTTAIACVFMKSLFDRRDGAWWTTFPGLAAAISLHSFFNHFFISPEITTLLVLAVLPATLILVFRQSDIFMQRWLGTGFDHDMELLQMIDSGEIASTRLGQYLLSLKKKFKGEVVADMLCVLRIYLELSLSAKGILLMRKSGFEPHIKPEIVEQFNELKYLEKKIGPTGRLAMGPVLQSKSQDLWQLHFLQESH
jgi:RsiW-degrading membrane proteinase PrsW (M82 family)